MFFYFILEVCGVVQIMARCDGYTGVVIFEMTVSAKDCNHKYPLFKENTLNSDYDDFLNGRKLLRNILMMSIYIIYRPLSGEWCVHENI